MEQKPKNKKEEEEAKIPLWFIIALLLLSLIIVLMAVQSSNDDWNKRELFTEKCTELGYNKAQYFSGNLLIQKQHFCLKTEQGVKISRLEIYDVDEFIGKTK
jgi:hypothetical protein